METFKSITISIRAYAESLKELAAQTFSCARAARNMERSIKRAKILRCTKRRKSWFGPPCPSCGQDTIWRAYLEPYLVNDRIHSYRFGEPNLLRLCDCQAPIIIADGDADVMRLRQGGISAISGK